MRKVGFRGKAARIIYNIFSDTRNTVRFDRATYSRIFKSTTGVWQGSSPSTLLPTLVLEPFVQTLRETFKRTNESTTLADGTLLHCLCFCGDFVLLAGSMSELRDKMMTFLEWCPDADVKPHESSTGKSKIMVFGKE